jgi:hypothetical protein
MSWDVLLLKLPQNALQPQDVPDDYVAPAIGSRAEVASVLRKVLRSLECNTDSFSTLSCSSFAMEIILGDEEPCSQLLLHVHGDGGEATKTILRVAKHLGLRAIDCSTTEFIEKGRRKRLVSEKEREDEARYRRILEEHRKNAVPPPAWPLSGLSCLPCERFVYVSLLAGESPRQQQKAVFRHLENWIKEHGKLPACVGGPRFLLTLPDGETLGDFSVIRHPALVTETEAEMIPRVQEGAALVYALGSATGRRCGEIQNGAEFVCSDGQRIPLAECSYHMLQTKADWAKKSKGKKGCGGARA